MANASIFISYSHKDELEKEALLTHLGVLQRENLIDVWVDDRIRVGGDWSEEIEDAINRAQVAILLVTANFLTSNFILNEEIPKLLRRRRDEGLVIFPIIAKPCAWDKVSWLSIMNLRPKNGTPIWREGGRYVDDELATISREVARIIEGVHATTESVPTGETHAIPEEFRYLLEIQSQINFKDEIVDQNVVPIFVRELDLAGIRSKPATPTTFSSFTEQLLRTRKNTIIVGEAGVGKTTELLKLAKQLSLSALSNGPECFIPVFVELKHFTSITGQADDLTDHLCSLTRLSSNHPRQDLQDHLKKEKRFIFILDGINEISTDHLSETVNALIRFIKLYPYSQYVISTRYYGFDEQFLNIGGIPFGCYEIQTWDDVQLKLFFQSNNAMEALSKIDPKISELCRIPFVAHLLLNVIKSSEYEQEKFPKNKGELYTSYVEYIFTRRDAHVARFTKEEKVSLLAKLAYFMNEQGTLSWKYKHIQAKFGGDVDRTVQAAIFQEIIKNGILRQGDVHFLRDPDDETPIEFMHQSLQEYFTAVYITQITNQEFSSYLPMNNLENTYWSDVPIYLAGLLEDPIVFISALLGNEKQDDYLLLAAKCLVSCTCDPASYQETVENIIDTHLIQSMQNDRYTKDAIEIVRTFGEKGVQLLLSHLDNRAEIIEVRALTGDEAIERIWRKYGRIIYILGELRANGLVDKLRDVYSRVKDIHLLYHIVIALYTLGSDEAMDFLRADYLNNHPDPVIRALSTLAAFRLTNEEYKVSSESRNLIEALTANINNQAEMEYALRAHSAEVLGLLGLREAIAPLAYLLRNEKRVEPQSSAVKALGYIATKHKRADINGEILDALIDSLEHGSIYNNQWGKKLIKELMSWICSKEDVVKLNNAIKRINDTNESENIKQKKKEVLQDVIYARQTRE